MSFRVLSAAADKEEWDRVFALLPPERRDVHFSSAYGRVQKERGEGDALLAVEESSDGVIMQPLLRRIIDGLGRFDLATMGYGGPIASYPTGQTPGPMLFYFAFRDWASDSCLCEWTRLHPLYAHEQLPLTRQHNIVWDKQAVVVHLHDYSLAMTSRRIRRAVMRAETLGASFYEVPAGALQFNELYTFALRRINADKRWSRSLEYFLAHTHEHVGARWFFMLAPPLGARRALLTIGLGRFAYAQYLGSNGGAENMGLDAFLYHRAALALSASGYEAFHLGGGLQDGDSIHKFKAGFSDQQYAVGSYFRVFDSETYSAHVARKEEEEIAQHGRISASEWLPAYRRGFV